MSLSTQERREWAVARTRNSKPHRRHNESSAWADNCRQQSGQHKHRLKPSHPLYSTSCRMIPLVLDVTVAMQHNTIDSYTTPQHRSRSPALTGKGLRISFLLKHGCFCTWNHEPEAPNLTQELRSRVEAAVQQSGTC